MAKLLKCRCCSEKISDEAKYCPNCGQPEPHHNYKLINLIKNRRKLQAVKLYASENKCSLEEAKMFIDELAKNITS